MSEEQKNKESSQDVEFEAVLDRELERVLDGRTSVDECCAANPGFADELKPLLQLALSGRLALVVDDLPTAATMTARKKLVAQARSLDNTVKSGGKLRLRPLALASGLFLLLFAGTALAAGYAKPDSLLYPLKQGLESAQTTLAMQELDRARAEAEHANSRLDELQSMIDEGKSEYCESLLADYELRINNASAHAAAAASDGEDTSEVDAFIGSVRDRHDEMVKSLGLEGPEGEEGQAPGAGGEDNAAGVDDSDDSYPGSSGGTPSGNYRNYGDDDDRSGSNRPGGSNGSGGGDSQDDEYRQDDDGNGDDDSLEQSESSDRNEGSDGGFSHDDSPKQEHHGDSSDDRNGPAAAKS